MIEELSPDPSTNGHEAAGDVAVLVDALDARGLTPAVIVEMLEDLDGDPGDVDDEGEP